jgi:hypothetical protein
MRFARPLALLVASIAITSAHGCGGGDVVAHFQLDASSLPGFLEVPYPTDAYLDSTGHVMNPIPGFDAVITENGDLIERELAEMDGFSRLTHALFWVDDTSLPRDEDGNLQSATIDESSLPYDENACVSDASSVFLIDLEATDPTKARVPCRAHFHDDRDLGSSLRPVVAVGPARGVVLDEGHRYAAVLTSRVHDTDGRDVKASESFLSLPTLAAPSPTEKLYQDALATADGLLAPALADGTTIVAIAPFTTHTRARELFQARATLDTIPTPTLSFAPQDEAPMGAARFSKLVNGSLPAGFTASLDDWLGVVDPKNVLPDGQDDWDNQLPVRAHNKIAAMGTAVFDAANFLQDLPGGFDVPQQEHFARDANGNIIQNPADPTYKIWVTIAVPDAPMPAGGYPTIILQHGMSASREYMVSVANVFCAKGWLVAGIDSITFGARAREPEYQVDQTTDYVGGPGVKYDGPDGIADITSQGRNPVTDLFGNFQNFGAIRDQLREAALDTAQLFRVLASDPDLSPLATDQGTPHIDPTHIAYVGESLGSLEGEMAAAIEPRIDPWIFSVGGGGFIFEAGVHGPGIGALLGAAAGLYFHFLHDRLTEFHPLTNLLQSAVEAADPLLYARDIVRTPQPVSNLPPKAHSVMLLECIYDELFSNEAGEAWAREAGLLLASPDVGVNSGVTDLTNPSAGRWHVPLQEVFPDASGTIHDVPQAGLTGVVVQQDPCDHGSDWVSSKGSHQFAIPYVDYSGASLYKRLDTAFDIVNPYRPAAEQFVEFISDAFAGKAPGVVVHTAPVRDFDGDGVTDDVDKAPSDPTVH